MGGQFKGSKIKSIFIFINENAFPVFFGLGVFMSSFTYETHLGLGFCLISICCAAFRVVSFCIETVTSTLLSHSKGCAWSDLWGPIPNTGPGEAGTKVSAMALRTVNAETLFMEEVCRNLETVPGLWHPTVLAILWGMHSWNSHKNRLPPESVKNNPIRRLREISTLGMQWLGRRSWILANLSQRQLAILLLHSRLTRWDTILIFLGVCCHVYKATHSGGPPHPTSPHLVSTQHWNTGGAAWCSPTRPPVGCSWTRWDVFLQGGSWVLVLSSALDSQTVVELPWVQLSHSCDRLRGRSLHPTPVSN